MAQFNTKSNVFFFYITVAILIPHVTEATIYDWWQQPYGNNEFNSDVLFNDNVTLRCSDDDGNDVIAEPETQYWILPDLNVMYANESRNFETIDGTALWSVSSDAMNMEITLLQPEHFGFYYCVYEYDSKTSVVKKAINYNGPYFGSVWDKYEMNFIVAFSASAGFLVAFSTIFGIYLWKFSDERDSEKEEFLYSDSTVTNSSENNTTRGRACEDDNYTAIPGVNLAFDGSHTTRTSDNEQQSDMKKRHPVDTTSF